jgi:hypothetical protein
MDIDVSSLSDLPPETILIQTKQQSDDQTNHRNKNAKQFNERISLNNQLLTEKFERLFFYFLNFLKKKKCYFLF